LASLESGSFLVSSRHCSQNGLRQSGKVFKVDRRGEEDEFLVGKNPFGWTGSTVLKLDNQKG